MGTGAFVEEFWTKVTNYIANFDFEVFGIESISEESPVMVNTLKERAATNYFRVQLQRVMNEGTHGLTSV